MDEKALRTRQTNTMRKYEKIVKHVDYLYHQKRVRIDDVYKQTMEEFCVSMQTIRRAIRAVEKS